MAHEDEDRPPHRKPPMVIRRNHTMVLGNEFLEAELFARSVPEFMDASN